MRKDGGTISEMMAVLVPLSISTGPYNTSNDADAIEQTIEQSSKIFHSILKSSIWGDGYGQISDVSPLIHAFHTTLSSHRNALVIFGRKKTNTAVP